MPLDGALRLRGSSGGGARDFQFGSAPPLNTRHLVRSGDLRPMRQQYRQCVRTRRVDVASLMVALMISGCGFGAGDEVKDGFVMTVASYLESRSDGESKYVGVFRNVGEHADRVEFSITLEDVEDDGPAWTGRGFAEDVDEGETVQVEMVGETPPPVSRTNDVEFTVERG